MSSEEGWHQYLEEVRRYVETGLLDSEEIDYKLATERRLQEARRAVLEREESCLDFVVRAINSNLTSTWDKTGLRNWFREQPQEAQEALRALWAEDERLSTADRFRVFTPLIPESLPSGQRPPTQGAGTRLRWISVLLMARDARQYPPYKVTEFKRTYERTGYPVPPSGDDEASQYEHALGFLDETIERARRAGLKRPKDRLEAQSVLFAVAGGRGAEPSTSSREPEDVRYWLMSLGHGSELWPAHYESGTASIGFDEDAVGDLRHYDSQEEVGRVIGSESGPKRMHDRLALWEFSHEMEPGDVVFVKRGRQHVVGRGTVRSLYRYDRRRKRHRHLRDVDWESNFWPDGRPVRGDKPLVTKTLLDVTKYPDLVADLEAAVRLEGPIPIPEVDHDRNQILYGPPGTGKTYETLNHALAIIDGVSTNTIRGDRNSARERRRQLRFTAPSGLGGHARGQMAMLTFHQNYSYEDFVEGIRPVLTANESPERGTSDLSYELRHGIFRTICRAAEDAPVKRFVLIIDEINRGNIPKIFGELITLIEPSRRLGREDETKVSLPYSGDDFGVPDNLYIIGTMNTADRSIQQMDTALRRRFTFVEKMPDADHGLIPDDVEGVNLRKMLRTMNERIALLLDREHQIGHTYLLEVDTIERLADTFRNRIFPLLQEYFYDDWRKIRAVLGQNSFVREERRPPDPATQGLADESGITGGHDLIYGRLPFSSGEWENADQYRRIYTGSQDR